MSAVCKIIDNKPVQVANNGIWKLNTKDSEGYVESGEGQINKVWGTDDEGNPGWKDGVNMEELKNNFVSKSGDTLDGTLKVQTLVIGTTPSDEEGAIWIE